MTIINLYLKLSKMAICNENGATTFFGSRLHIEAIQSVMPTKQTDPRPSHRVLIPDDHKLGSGIFQRRFQMVMFYKKAFDEDSGWLMAGWIKESLGKALSEMPIFAGRLRRGENGEKGDLEVVANDSGARLVEASVAMDLIEFLDLKEKTEAEAELVFWENVDEKTPQFFPLFYVQVTNFRCGGFSIGISCSLLVADPFSMITFLKKWSDIHNNMVSSGNDTTKIPIFYLHNLRRTGSYPSLPIDPSSRAKAGKSTIFKIIASKTLHLDDESFKNLAALCIHEAEKRLAKKTASNFSLLWKESSGNVKVENISGAAISQKPLNTSTGFISASWDDLQVDKIQFSEVMEPIHVSSWINSVSEDGFLMIVPSSEDGVGMNIVVTFRK